MGETRSVTHSVTTTAAAADVYGLVADVTRWSVLFGPTIHVDVLERDGSGERFRIWATAAGAVANWTSRRTFHPARRRIGFQQERSAPPIARMSGEWEFRDRLGGGAEVLLHHEFTTEDGSADSVDHVLRVLDTNSTAELDGLRRVAELGQPVDELVFSFEETVRADDPRAVYDFIERADEWPRRLDHVRAVELREEPSGVQWMTMDTLAPDGSAHTTESVRVCDPGRRVLYKQTRPPAALLGHSGAWTFDGDRVTSRHTVLLDPGAVADGDLRSARERVTAALRANSAKTLEAALRSRAS
ncbi:aromatase/cyclase [Actinosynnema sp. NPDC051121]